MNLPELLVVFILASLVLIVFMNEREAGIVRFENELSGSGSLLANNLVDVVIIKPDCAECYDAEGFVDSLAGLGLNVSSARVLDASEGYDLIQKYSVTRLPAVVFSTAIINYSFYQGLSYFGSLEPDAFVFRSPTPPFYDVVSGDVVDGGVTVTYVNHSGCGKCYDVLVHRDILVSNYGVNIVGEVFVNESSSLIELYNITKLPTIILSPEAAFYPGLVRVWPTAGRIAGDGSFVFTEMSALGKVWYFDLESGEIR